MNQHKAMIWIGIFTTFMIIMIFAQEVMAYDQIEFPNSEDFNIPSEWYMEEVELFAYEKADLGEYALEYRYIASSSLVEQLVIFNISNENNNLIIGSVSEIYKHFNETIIVNESKLAFRINERKSKTNSLLATIWTNSDVFGKVNISTTAPEFLNANPGDKFTIPFTLENSGAVDDVYHLDISKSECYSYYFTSNSLKVTDLSIERGDKKEVNLVIEISESCKEQEYHLRIDAEGRGRAYLNFSLEVIGKNRTKLSTAIPEHIVVHPGDKICIPLTLENVYDKITEFELVSEAPKGWDVIYQYDGVEVDNEEFEVDRVKIKSKGSMPLKAIFRVPSTITEGEFNITFKALCNDYIYSSIMHTFKIGKGESDIKVRLSELYTSGKAGSETEVSARIVNNGKTTLTDVELDIELPHDNWAYELSKESINEIEAEEYGDIIVKIKIPVNTDVGDYFVNIRATSDQQESEEVKLRINVVKKNSSLWIGIFIIVLTITGLIYVFKKYGRR